MNCLICKNKCTINLKKGFFKNLKNYFCESCGTYFYERNNKLYYLIKEYYSKKYWDSKKNKISINNIINNFIFIKGERSRFEFIKNNLLENNKFLEIGMGKGEFITYLNKHKKLKLYGIEPDIKNSDNIKKSISNIKIYNSTFEKVKFNTKFDFIYLSHVFEHFINIDEIIKKII